MDSPLDARHYARVNRLRHALGDGALALFGALAWMPCLVLGVLIGAAVGIPDRPEGVTQGGDYGLASAAPEIGLVTVTLLVLAYGSFFWMLRRR